jgi:hypothetical protein
MEGDSGVAGHSADFEMRPFWTHFDAPLERQSKTDLFGKLDCLDQLWPLIACSIY